MSRNFNAHGSSIKRPNLHRLVSAVFVFFTLLLSSAAIAQLDAPAAGVATLPSVLTSAVLADTDVIVPLDEGKLNHEGPRSSMESTADVDLPDAPSSGQVAPIYTKYVVAGFTAQPITAHDKVLIGLRDLYTPFAFGGFFAAAAYGQILNGQPNYGTDRGAFGARLGAAAIGATAEGIFTDTVFAPLLHEDPRYYVEGPQFGLMHRAVYAATRPLVTRTDTGRRSVNGALLLGYAAAAALSLTYYPESNRNFHDAIATFGGSIGGESLDFVLREFSSDVLERLHLTTKE